MESQNKNLERRLENGPDWKQWIPIYGVIKALVDEESIASPIDKNGNTHLLRYFGSAFYHTAVSYYPIYKMVESFLQN